MPAITIIALSSGEGGADGRDEDCRDNDTTYIVLLSDRKAGRGEKRGRHNHAIAIVALLLSSGEGERGWWVRRSECWWWEGRGRGRHGRGEGEGGVRVHASGHNETTMTTRRRRRERTQVRLGGRGHDAVVVIAASLWPCDKWRARTRRVRWVCTKWAGAVGTGRPVGLNQGAW